MGQNHVIAFTISSALPVIPVIITVNVVAEDFDDGLCIQDNCKSSCEF